MFMTEDEGVQRRFRTDIKGEKKTFRTEKRRFMRDDEGEKGRYRMDKKKKSTELEEWRRKETQLLTNKLP